MKAHVEMQQEQDAPLGENQQPELLKVQNEEGGHKRPEQRGQLFSITIWQLTDHFSRTTTFSGRTHEKRIYKDTWRKYCTRAILRAGGVNTSAAMEQSASFDHHIAMQAALAIPEEAAPFHGLTR